MKTHFECGLNAFPDADYRGMTLRDYFAAKAMLGVAQESLHIDEIAAWAYKMADAMLKAREA
jgi:hypothetical protein